MGYRHMQEKLREYRLTRLFAPFQSLVNGRLRRLSERVDTDQEQASVRVVLGGIVIIYMLTAELDGSDARASATVSIVAVLFFLAALSLLIASLRRSGSARLRRYCGILLDISATSVAMGVSGETGTPLLGIYLWVIVGNGFRYGNHYLEFATAASLIGFAGVAFFADYWREHYLLGISYLLVLLLIPAYIAAFLRQLRAAMREANEANSAKSEFLARMSHELRTPLNGVIGMSELLMDSPLEAEEREFVGTIYSSGRTLLAVIDNILDFSKIESGRLATEEVEFDVHQVVAETVAMFVPQARRQGVTLTSRCDPRVPFSLIGDPLHIRQVLTNLIGNAIKFTPAGSVDVRVIAATGDIAAEDNRVMVRFEVEDTGIGIAPEDQARIFESFQQAGVDIARRFGGTGLGTAIAHELVDLMGGRIGVKSTLGAGSLFWFELLLEHFASPLLEPDQGLADERVLVVGLHDRVDIVAEMLSAMGMQVQAVNTDVEAVKAADQAREADLPFKLVFALEQQVCPESLANILQATGRGTGALCFLLTEGARRQHLAAFRVGCDGVLGLPLRRDEFLNALHAARSLRALPENVVSLAERSRRLAPADGARLHVLIAEDNETNRRVLRAILARAGHRLTVVEDGDAALDALQRQGGAFDLLVLDKNMPGLNGLDVFRAQTFMFPEAPIPTIILSAEATAAAMESSLKAGVDAYLTKPVESQRLLQTIARLGYGHKGLALVQSDADSPARATRSDASAPLVDTDKIASLRRLSDNAEFYTELVAGFQSDAERSILALTNAMGAGDYPAMREVVHALEGSSMELGAVGLAGVAGQFRRLKPFELNSDRAQDLLEQVRQTLAVTLQRLTDSSTRAKDDSLH